MKGKKVVITGAGSGLGQSLAQRLSQDGAEIILLGRTREKLEKTANTLNGPSVIFSVDIRNKSDLEHVFSQINDLDILINNAGTGRFGNAELLSREAVDKMIDTNLKGTIYCTQAVLPLMKQRKQGLIVNIISTAGKKGKAEESVYCASKFGVRGFTESLNIELQDTPIQVAAFYIGGMNTSFWDGILEEEKISGFMDPDDVAEIVIENIKTRTNINIKEVVIDRQK